MSTIDVLQKEYPGDEAWKKYAAIISLGVSDEEIRYIQGTIHIDRELAATIVGIFGYQRAYDWLNQGLDALDGKSPQEILDIYPNGTNIIRSFLMRIPI